MKKSLYIVMMMCLLSGWTVRAQRTVDLDFRQVTLNVVFDAIERQTGQPVYRQPLETDSMVVSVHSEKEEPLVALRRALEGTPFQVSSYSGAFFVLRDNTLMTSLPENFFLREKRREGDGDEEGSGISLMAGRKQQKATSENKVYEIGDASGKAADRVTVTGNISDFKTGEPMVGVAVFVKDPMIGATTDAYGYYTLRLPPGRHELYIQGMGMKDTRRQIMLYSDGKLDIAGGTGLHLEGGHDLLREDRQRAEYDDGSGTPEGEGYKEYTDGIRGGGYHEGSHVAPRREGGGRGL